MSEKTLQDLLNEVETCELTRDGVDLDRSSFLGIKGLFENVQMSSALVNVKLINTIKKEGKVPIEYYTAMLTQQIAMITAVSMIAHALLQLCDANEVIVPSLLREGEAETRIPLAKKKLEEAKTLLHQLQAMEEEDAKNQS